MINLTVSQYYYSVMNLNEFLEIKERNIYEVYKFFSRKIENLTELYLILLKYSTPFFDNEENDTVYLGKMTPEKRNQIIVWENNNSLILLFDGILTLLNDANYLGTKILQRSVFEFLVINNHIILTNDYEYTSKWINEKDVKIVKNILKRTDHENAGELIDFWVGLSKQTHAGTWTTQSGLDMNETFGEYIGNIFSTYMLLYFYNYQLRQLYFPYMQSVYREIGIRAKNPYRSDWFKKRDKIRELENPYNSEKLHHLVKAFECKWQLK